MRRWRSWIARIKCEVGDLRGSQKIFVELREVLDRNPAIGNPGGFLRWMIQNCVESTAVGIRRVCDHRKDVVSLARLLCELLEYPGLLTFRSHQRLYPVNLREHAPYIFERHAGRKRTALSPRSVRRDLRRIEDVAARIQKHVNNRVAHLAPPGQLRRRPTFGEVGEALAALDRTTTKYLVLLTAKGDATCAPAPQHDWREVLLQPWLIEEHLGVSNREHPLQVSGDIIYTHPSGRKPQ